VCQYKNKDKEMYYVCVKDTDETIAICSRLEDALSYLAAQDVDKCQYVIKDMTAMNTFAK
jgi:hypothetical protein